MPQALRNRYPTRDERLAILDYAQNYGPGETMLKYSIRSSIAFEKFLIDISGDPNIIAKCIANSEYGKRTFARIADELILEACRSKARADEMASKYEVAMEKVRLVEDNAKMDGIRILRMLTNGRKAITAPSEG